MLRNLVSEETLYLNTAEGEGRSLALGHNMGFSPSHSAAYDTGDFNMKVKTGPEGAEGREKVAAILK